MLDRDLAELYGVDTRTLNQAVKRNASRFPNDFMFRLTLEEGKAVLPSESQAAASKRGQNLKYQPYAFTEHGTVMLANVLRSPVAVRASLQVVRAFVRLRQVFAANHGLAQKIAAVERKVGKHDKDLKAILTVLQRLLQPAPARAKQPVGFVPAGSSKPRSQAGAGSRLVK
jgi:hypothetical protein